MVFSCCKPILQKQNVTVKVFLDHNSISGKYFIPLLVVNSLFRALDDLRQESATIFGVLHK
jgi:hypothetical protein